MGLKELSFEDWIDTLGIERTAKILKVNPMTVYYWRMGRNDPKVDQMRRIKRLTHGAISYEKIIDRKVLTSRVPRVRG